MTARDALIIGGGVIGLAVGWRMAAAGAAVTLADAGLPAASDAAAGMLAPSFEHGLNAGAALEALARASLAAWPAFGAALEAASGASIDLDLSGILEVAFDARGAGAFGAAALSPAEASEIAPGLSPRVLAARFAPGEGQVDARRLKRALELAFQNAGGALVRGARIVSLNHEGGRFAARGADGVPFAAASVVVASGARGLAPSLSGGEAGMRKGAVHPVKGEALALAQRPGGPTRVVRSTGAYLCPKADGRIIIGASEAPRDWSLSADPARIAELREGAAEAFPALAGAPTLSAWAGLRPATADGAPILGAAPGALAGLMLALGHYRNGILLAPETARLIAEAALNGAGIDAAFSPARFAAPDNRF